jgi:hypothetical protein
MDNVSVRILMEVTKESGEVAHTIELTYKGLDYEKLVAIQKVGAAAIEMLNGLGAQEVERRKSR